MKQLTKFEKKTCYCQGSHLFHEHIIITSFFAWQRTKLYVFKEVHTLASESIITFPWVFTHVLLRWQIITPFNVLTLCCIKRIIIFLAESFITYNLDSFGLSTLVFHTGEKDSLEVPCNLVGFFSSWMSCYRLEGKFCFNSDWNGSVLRWKATHLSTGSLYTSTIALKSRDILSCNYWERILKHPYTQSHSNCN